MLGCDLGSFSVLLQPCCALPLGLGKIIAAHVSGHFRQLFLADWVALRRRDVTGGILTFWRADAVSLELCSTVPGEGGQETHNVPGRHYAWGRFVV